jgi:hypothetical protein
LERLERQADVLQRQLKSLREHGWLPGLPQTRKMAVATHRHSSDK